MAVLCFFILQLKIYNVWVPFACLKEWIYFSESKTKCQQFMIVKVNATHTNRIDIRFDLKFRNLT